MQTFNQSLVNAYFAKLITLEMALSRSSNSEELQDMINRGVTSPLLPALPPPPFAAEGGCGLDFCAERPGQAGAWSPPE